MSVAYLWKKIITYSSFVKKNFGALSFFLDHGSGKGPGRCEEAANPLN